MSGVAEGFIGTDDETVTMLRAGDEQTFRRLVAEHHSGLRRMAAIYLPHDVIDDVVQETWIAVIRGIDRFEGRSSLKTWIYKILINQAKKRFPKENRAVPFSASAPGPDPVVAAERLVHPVLGPNYWASVPRAWDAEPEQRSLATEFRQVVATAIDSLPGGPKEVITLRDIEGWSAGEVCDVLGISAVNQRVQLHRGRARVRQAIEEYFHEE